MNGLIFPGQGSQTIGMANFLFENFDFAKKRFEEASDATGVDFKKLCFEGPADELNLTENTQPALVLASVCYYEALNSEIDLKPVAAAGHSLGEYSAMVAMGAMNFSDAIKSVKARGKAMQEAVPVGKGGMLAVMGLKDEDIARLCEWTEQESGFSPLRPANYNAPGQTVISGSKEACDWLVANFNPELFGNPRRSKFIPLKVSAPFHCPMMEPAQIKMKEVLSEVTFNSISAPIVQNVSAKAETEPETLKANLIEQVSAPVRWIECIQQMKELGCNNLVELGPGRVLAGLVKKIDSEAFTTFNMQNMEDFKDLVEKLRN